ncbi:hypothetical protein E1091_01095, partial [Micromonospora fluostatini]
MARYLFGGGIADWTFVPTTLEETANLAQLAGGIEITLWSAPEGGTRYTDLLDMDTEPVTAVITSSGGDGQAVGQIPQFWGPDGVAVLWASAGGGPRAAMRTLDLPAHLHDAADIATGVLDPARLPAGGGTGIGDPGVLWVAAADAPPEFAVAQYVCDGVDDQVEIQAAIDAAAGRLVRLSPGGFELSAPVTLVGSGDLMTPVERTLAGYGAAVTTLTVGTGVSAAIQLSAGVTPHLGHFRIVIDGASHGISSVSTGGDPGFVGGTFASLRVEGSYEPTQTGW